MSDDKVNIFIFDTFKWKQSQLLVNLAQTCDKLIEAIMEQLGYENKHSIQLIFANRPHCSLYNGYESLK